MEQNKFIGEAFEELSDVEMESLQGSGEIAPLSSVPCAITISFVLGTIAKC